MSVRVRYAPSPTGDPHVGNIRTALWSWLFARRHGGQFLVRLEDTDQSRAVPGSLERILGSLSWLGVDWDEGPDIGGPYAPYVQSERLDLYHREVDRLVEQGDAYPCFCSAEDLDEMRARQRAENRPPGYDGRCRLIPRDEAAARAASESHVVRFAMPREGSTTFSDLLRGEITVENKLLDDFVILKSDRYPTYHLAHPVDDHAMAITHVTRGEEWLPSTPRHVQLFRALGYEPPVYVHNSVILGPDGGKLSKRHGAKSTLEYRDDGYLPEALFNFLVMLGWSVDDHTEIIGRDELIQVFDIERLSVTPAVFDTQKLEWMNGVYLRDLPEARIAEAFAERLDADLPSNVPRPPDASMVAALVPLVRERIKVLSELAELVDFFFTGHIETPDAEALRGRPYRNDLEGAITAAEAALETLTGLVAWEPEAMEAALRETAERLGQRAGNVFMVCRVATTGRSITPPLFESMELIGRDACLERLRAAIEVLRGA
ncbi:MAG: glutamate--tRNA ligase [Dehalococcoidia bacterium]